MNILLIWFGKLLSQLINNLKFGRGSTWPGHIALNLNPRFINETLKNSKVKIVLIAGTNGKTTTSKLIKTILENSEKKILHNEAGANLENGLASTLIKGSNLFGKVNYDYLIFESDENTLPIILNRVKPDFLILLNLFRDQLDRYGEVDSIARKWNAAVQKINKKTKLIANADDASIAYIALKSGLNSQFFGLNKGQIRSIPHGADTIYCPRCDKKLNFEFINFSHLGKWSCSNCKLKRPNLNLSELSFYPLPGTYNKYNALASVLFSRLNRVHDSEIEQSFKNFKPAFGRQEIVKVSEKNIQLFLSKNPTSFNESLKTISTLGAKNILIILNDRIPDGRDVSWIWDINLKPLISFKKIFLSGERVYDLALRIKYENIPNFQTFENLEQALNIGLKNTNKSQTLYVLPTYSAMLETRKILTGRSIL